MSFQNVLVEHHGPVARLTINRPKAMNALDPLTLDELTRAIVELGGDEGTRAIVLTGAGEKAFVAGADIKGMAAMTAAEAEEFGALGHRLGDAIGRLPKIVIAAVNGFALGGVCELALACDFIYASETAKFGQPEVNLGVIPGFGGTTRLPRRIGVARAIEMVTSAETVGAAEALRIGLVNRVFPASELLTAAHATAEMIAKKGPIAVAAAKRSLRASQELSLEDNNKLEVQLFGQCFASADQKEGMLAFIEKRPATFTGK